MQTFEVTVTRTIEANNPSEAVAKARWEIPTQPTIYEVTGGDAEYGSLIATYEEVV